ncbi:hypothetical protein ACIP1U_20940 [Cupriavidus sp. NPDC089707]|uniref:hypothetical protein n=1 Tax=Cupriavidus sp. NPDC089707 TaxID=3363963 RepID=UPI0037F423A8
MGFDQHVDRHGLLQSGHPAGLAHVPDHLGNLPAAGGLGPAAAPSVEKSMYEHFDDVSHLTRQITE